MEYGEGGIKNQNVYLIFRLKCNYHVKIFSTYLPIWEVRKMGEGWQMEEMNYIRDTT